MNTTELTNYLKQIAKSQGITQKVIAEYFGVSLPTVKRWYAGSNMSIEQASRLCTFLGTTLGQSLMAIEKSNEYFSYTNEQELFFSKNPDYLAFFDLILNGNRLNSIKKKYKISDRQLTKYLLKLDKLKLIELNEKNRFKLLVSGEPRWKKNGPLSLTYKKEIFQKYLSQKSSILEKFNTSQLHQNDIEQIQKKAYEISVILNRANQRAKNSSEKSSSYGFHISLKPYSWDLDSYLIK